MLNQFELELSLPEDPRRCWNLSAILEFARKSEVAGCIGCAGCHDTVIIGTSGIVFATCTAEVTLEGNPTVQGVEAVPNASISRPGSGTLAD